MAINANQNQMPFEIAENKNSSSQCSQNSAALMLFHDDNRHLFDGISQLKSESEVSTAQ